MPKKHKQFLRESTSAFYSLLRAPQLHQRPTHDNLESTYLAPTPFDNENVATHPFWKRGGYLTEKSLSLND